MTEVECHDLFCLNIWCLWNVSIDSGAYSDALFRFYIPDLLLTFGGRQSATGWSQNKVLLVGCK